MKETNKSFPSFLNPQNPQRKNPLTVPPAAAMANSLTESDSIHRLPDLHDALIITILSFLPTHIAARTSVLSRRFRHLWEASPSIALISKDLRPQVKFVAMANRALLSRNPSYPLLSLCLEVSNYFGNSSFLSSLLTKAHSLDLCHLTIKGFDLSEFLTIAPIVFTFHSLRSLALDLYDFANYCQELKFPSEIKLTNLRSLSLQLFDTDMAILNPVLSELCSLEVLHLYLISTHGLSLSSKTIRKLKLVISTFSQQCPIVNLSLPSLESLNLEIKGSLKSLNIHGEVPLLRKAVINVHNIDHGDVSVVAGMLNFISHVEELSLHLKETEFNWHPVPILLESAKDVPEFHKLENLDLSLCFHEDNLEAVTTMLHNYPALKSLKLVHEVPKFTKSARRRTKRFWGSRLPMNADGTCYAANNLHLEENLKQVIKLLSYQC